ncbi:hypothetical protein BJ741DRAFT_243798 [Chytriomyces cf. hyalinus JEL632]|nr:hypothetical protein BJ741DRAFT_243798 [Chytriomyces cf. hyalinus JEL632]
MRTHSCAPLFPRTFCRSRRRSPLPMHRRSRHPPLMQHIHRHCHLPSSGWMSRSDSTLPTTRLCSCLSTQLQVTKKFLFCEADNFICAKYRLDSPKPFLFFVSGPTHYISFAVSSQFTNTCFQSARLAQSPSINSSCLPSQRSQRSHPTPTYPRACVSPSATQPQTKSCSHPPTLIMIHSKRHSMSQASCRNSASKLKLRKRQSIEITPNVLTLYLARTVPASQMIISKLGLL